MNNAILYTQPGCGPCIALKRKLAADRHEFTEVNIREDADAADHIRELGYTGTPVLEYTDTDGERQSFHGFRSDILEGLKPLTAA